MASQIPLKLQAFYSIGELARLTSMSKKRIRLMLTNVGITSHLEGGLRIVFISDIEARLPALWASIVACARMQVVVRTIEEAHERGE